LYKGISVVNKRGYKHFKLTFLKNHFRLVIVKSKTQEDKEFWFLKNNFELTAKEIAEAYRRRWDIEVFYRFIKQELNVSHLVALNKNGMQVMIYMTIILAMLILIYTNENNIGYKTALRRFSMEIRNLSTSIIAVYYGGDSKLFFKT
jgi:IS4 transposase